MKRFIYFAYLVAAISTFAGAYFWFSTSYTGNVGEALSFWRDYPIDTGAAAILCFVAVFAFARFLKELRATHLGEKLTPTVTEAMVYALGIPSALIMVNRNLGFEITNGFKQWMVVMASTTRCRSRPSSRPSSTSTSPRARASSGAIAARPFRVRWSRVWRASAGDGVRPIRPRASKRRRIRLR